MDPVTLGMAKTDTRTYTAKTYQPIPYTTSPPHVPASLVTITGAGGQYPDWMSNDGRRVFCANNNTLYYSDDGFSTVVTSISNTSFGGTGQIKAVREAGDGELLLFLGSTNATIWKTVGYANGTAGPLAFTAVLKHSFTTASSGATSAWSVWVDPDIGVAACMEYDTLQSGASSARYGYLSKDFGNTWVTFFDRYASVGDPVATGLHPHGVAYDKFSDMFIATGGDDTNYILVCANWRTATTLASFVWTRLVYGGTSTSPWQAVAIYPLEHCILFMSDGTPNGVLRISRVNKDGSSWLTNPIIESAYRLDNSAGLRYLGFQMFRAKYFSPAPLLMCTGPTASGTSLERSKILMTLDGYSFTEIWREQANYVGLGAGIQTCVGPMLTSGRVLASRSAVSGTPDRMRFVMPAIVQGSPSQAGRYGYGDEDYLHPGLTRSVYAHHLMGPTTSPVMVAGAALSIAAALTPCGARHIAPRRGRVAMPHIFVGVSSGNIELSLYTGATPRVLLWTSGPTACPAAGWQKLGDDLAVIVEAGDEFVWYLTCDNITATFGKLSSGAATMTYLPADLGVTAGESYKLIERFVTAQASLGVMPATILGAALTSGISSGPVVLARIN